MITLRFMSHMKSTLAFQDKKQPVKITGRLKYVGLINYFLINFDCTVWPSAVSIIT